MAGFPWRWPSFPRDLSMVARVDALSLCCPPNLLSSSGTPPFGPSKALSFRCLPRSRTLRYAVFLTHTHTHPETFSTAHSRGSCSCLPSSPTSQGPYPLSGTRLSAFAQRLPPLQHHHWPEHSERAGRLWGQPCRQVLRRTLPLPSDLTLALSLAALPPSSGTWYEDEGRGPRGPSPPMTSSATFTLPPASPSPSSGLGGPQ